jgi:hypothetical protein
VSIPFWQEDPDAPYATLLSVVAGTCHPEAWEEAYADLQRIAREYPDTPRMIRFKKELRDALRDPARLPPGELFDAAQYSDGSESAFLARLWRDLYPGEAPPV